MRIAGSQNVPPRHILSFDVEEYFQVEAAAGSVAPDQWGSFPKRLERPMEVILQALADFGAKATFFVLGWVARHEPRIVQQIAAAGHEIASHGDGHCMITRQSPPQFHRDLLDSRRILEDLTGQRVVGYRAPTFSITHGTAWALDVLAEAGFLYDSSVFPVHHDRYGVSDAPTEPHRAVGPRGGQLIELPPLTLRVAGMNLPVGGGGYLRLLPLGMIHSALKGCQKRGVPGMIYLHPWELDATQPRLPLGGLANWRHRVNLDRTESKLRKLLDRYAFTDVQSLIPTLSDLPTFRYGMPKARAA